MKKWLSLIFVCFIALKNPEQQTIDVNGINGHICTITVFKGSNGREIISQIKQQCNIGRNQDCVLLKGTEKVLSGTVVSEDTTNLTLVIPDRPVVFHIWSRDPFNRSLISFRILDPRLCFLNKSVIEAFFRASRILVGWGGPYSLQEFFCLLRGRDCPCVPSYWNEFEGCLPYCNFDAILKLRESGGLQVFCHGSAMTTTEHRLFAIFITFMGGYFRYDEFSKLWVNRSFFVAGTPETNILGLTEPQEGKIGADHPAMLELIQRYRDGVGEFKPDAKGNIPDTHPEITRFMSGFRF